MSERVDQAKARLRALREAYAAALPTRLRALEAAWVACAGGPEEERLEAFRALAHELADSAALYGYPTLGLAARTLEIRLGGALLGGVTDEDHRRIPELLGELRTLAEAGGARGELARVAHLALPPTLRDRRVVLVETDPELSAELAGQLGLLGYEVERFDEPSRLVEAVAAHPAAALVADLDDGAVFDTVTALQRERERPLPVIFVSAHDDFERRLAAVRAGGVAYFTRPVETTALAERLDALVGGGQGDPYRILIVEESGSLGEYYRAVLEQAGMRAWLVSDPLAVMGPLVERQPDLVLIDAHLSAWNGGELAAVIRQQEAFLTVPIVFLSTESDIDLELEAMSRGGDDFLTMPVTGAQLAASVAARVVRGRALRALMVRDGLTGLLNHTRIKERLAAEVSRALREGAPLSFAMLDLDHFKGVNDRYGHAAGDRVLKTLGRFLSRRLRSSDVIGRYGGEEFAVVLPDTEPSVALTVLEEVRAGFAGILHRHEAHEFTVTLSGGVAAVPAYRDPETLAEAADRALYRAKRAGRDRVEVAD